MMDWNIQARSHVCQGCGRVFRDHEPLHTLLFDQRQAYQRLDVCESCWAAQYSQGANHRKGFVSHWQSIYSSPPASPPDPIQKETAESLLRKLLELNDPQHAGACFILAVMLERKRILKVKAQRVEEGRRVFIYEQAKTGDVFAIADPNLQLDQLDAVQRDVAQLLEQGVNPVGAAVPLPTSEASEPPAEPLTAEPAPPLAGDLLTNAAAGPPATPTTPSPAS
jgi:hypothetical protein